MDKHTLPNVIALLLIFTCTVAALYDLWALSITPPLPTITRVIWTWSTENPALAFATGFLMGHLFWRTY